jgi:hypothetical protein
MGTSTNAIIAFGFNLGDTLPDPLEELLEDGRYDLDDALAFDQGIVLPEQIVGKYIEYLDAKKAVLGQLKIRLIEHCSGGYPMYFLAAHDSHKVAVRGYPTSLEPDDLDAAKFGPDVIDAMCSFCDRHGIAWQEPKWHIFSMLY